MASRKSNRTSSIHELLSHVRRARQLAEHYDVHRANPDDFLTSQPPDLDALLNQIK